jgi:hypothetical protein
MSKKYKILFLFIFTIIFTSCTSIQNLKSYKRGNDFYIENLDSEGNTVGIDNIVINNVTFFPIKYNILGLTEKGTSPKQLWNGTVAMRTNTTLDISKELSKTGDSLANYKYLCIQFPEGTLKKCSSYSENHDVCIDIEQYGVEPNKDLNQIDDDLFEELEKSFNQ